MVALAHNSEPEDLPPVALALRALRQQAGLTQEELATKSGVAVRTVRNIERGDVVHPRWASLKLIADALGFASTSFCARRFPTHRARQPVVPAGHAGPGSCRPHRRTSPAAKTSSTPPTDF